jgi:hypothetical protein
MVLRMRDRELRLCGELSTATRRWRPADARGSSGARAGGQQGRGTGLGGEENDAWMQRRQEVDGDSLHSEEEEERGGGPGDLFAISRKFKDLSVN